MPIYEYRCGACGERIEAIQKISDRPLRKCPSCKKLKLRKLVSAAAFRLKGGGWYETDFKDKTARKNVAGAEEAGTAKVEKSETATTKKDTTAQPEAGTGETKKEKKESSSGNTKAAAGDSNT